MSANLNEVNGQVAFASLRESPWHKQGVVFDEPVSGKEMLKLAHLDWDVLESPVFTIVKKDGKDESATVPNKKAIYRSDTGAVLGITGENYQRFNNSEVIDFFEGLVRGKQIQYETAGALGAGETVWVQAKVPDLSYVLKGDEIISYMLIRTGHIGNLNLACHPTNVRTVCQNTMRAATAEFASRRTKYGKQSVHAGYVIRHTSGMRGAIQEVQDAYANLINDITKTRELYEILADRPVTPLEVRAYFEKTVKVKSEEEKAKELSKAAATRQDNKLDDLMKLWEAPTNQTGTRNTAFALMNTVIEWVDHEKSTRCVGETKTEDVCRFESANFGQGADMKDKALVDALALVG